MTHNMQILPEHIIILIKMHSHGTWAKKHGYLLLFMAMINTISEYEFVPNFEI